LVQKPGPSGGDPRPPKKNQNGQPRGWDNHRGPTRNGARKGRPEKRGKKKTESFKKTHVDPAFGTGKKKQGGQRGPSIEKCGGKEKEQKALKRGKGEKKTCPSL